MHAALDYWNRNNLGKIADSLASQITHSSDKNFTKAVKQVNGATVGISKRMEAYNLYLATVFNNK